MITPKERPILFSAPMVRAILNGTKTQTRRACKGQRELSNIHDFQLDRCPYGKIGELLWVRETFLQDTNGFIYRADGDFEGNAVILGGWKPSIYMPRWASRINLEVTGIRVERLQDISEEDAIAEGVRITDEYTGCADDIDSHRHAYKFLWESINGKGSWDMNPFVWVVEFMRIQP